MAVSANLATPLTLSKDQELSIPSDKTEIFCYNDSALTQRHYRTIPNDTSNEGTIKWGNVKSVLRSDGDYAVSVSMFEYIPSAGPSSIFYGMLQLAATNGSLANVPERGQMYIMPDSVYMDGGHVVFRKRVWVKNSDLILGSVAQQQAMTDAEKKKRQDELDALAKTDPVTGNSAGGNVISSTVYWVIGAIVLFVTGFIFLFKFLGKKRKEQVELDKKNSQAPVNVIRLPKS